MTTLLDRYLAAVAEALPKDVDRDDVLAEIADELQSQIEEGKNETEAIRAYGHPRVVAARYGRAQYLIGPELFPFYVLMLRNVLAGGIALVLLGGGLTAILLHDGGIFFESLGIAWNTAWWIAFVVTLLFAIAERTSSPLGRVTSRWDPLELPAPSAVTPVKWYSAIIEFVVNFIALLVLLDAWGPHHIPLDVQIAAILRDAHASLSAAWYPAYIATLAGSAILAGSALTVFVRPSFTALHEAFRMVANLVAAVGIGVTLANGPWIVAPEPGWNTAAQWLLISAIVVLLASTVTTALNLRNVLRATNAAVQSCL